jgi:short-subunit dehydrogenase
MARVWEHCGRIDVLVNNTGMTSTERFADRSLESMDREILVNTLSPLYVTRLALPLLRLSADPRVISTVSLAGIFPQPETPVYCASKFALRGAMLSIAMDLRAEGITVSSVLPSATDTRMLHREAITGGNLMQFQDPPQTPEVVAATMMRLLDRPRLEAYPKPRESYLVRAVMAVPNMLFVLVPFFEGKGVKGHQAYLRELIDRGDVVDIDGRLELAG